ncbi:MAG: GTP cyclohydrolase II [Verrucomicrobiales bacterium]
MKVDEYARCKLPTRYGEFDVRVYREGDRDEALTFAIGDDFTADENVFVRVHSECFTGEVLGSLKCDCQKQLDLAMERIAKEGRGLVVYLRQEGRGIGLGNKIRAYAEQAKGADTVEANHILGFPTDLRDFGNAADILKSLGIHRIDLNTNNPRKIEAMEEAGLIVNSIAPSLTAPTDHNKDYLETKARVLGHLNLQKATS